MSLSALFKRYNFYRALTCVPYDSANPYIWLISHVGMMEMNDYDEKAQKPFILHWIFQSGHGAYTAFRPFSQYWVRDIVGKWREFNSHFDKQNVNSRIFGGLD